MWKPQDGSRKSPDRNGDLYLVLWVGSQFMSWKNYFRKRTPTWDLVHRFSHKSMRPTFMDQLRWGRVWSVITSILVLWRNILLGWGAIWFPGDGSACPRAGLTWLSSWDDCLHFGGADLIAGWCVKLILPDPKESMDLKISRHHSRRFGTEHCKKLTTRCHCKLWTYLLLLSWCPQSWRKVR